MGLPVHNIAGHKAVAISCQIVVPPPVIISIRIDTPIGLGVFIVEVDTMKKEFNIHITLL